MKSLKNLIVPAVALLVLIIGAVIWFAVKPGDEDVVEEQTDVPVMVLSSTDISAIQVDKRIGDCIRFESVTDGDGIINWVLVDDDASNDNADLSDNTITNYIHVLTSFYANSVIAEPSGLADYGLETPEYTITYELNDGSVKKLYIGNTTYDNGNCYFKVDGDNSVYTCLTVKRVYAGYSYIDFLSSHLLDISFENIATVTFDRNTDNTHFTATCEILDTGSPVYYCVEPYQVKASAYFENLVANIVNLEIAGYLDIEDDQLADYGLDNPAFAFTFVLRNGQTVTIELSQNMGGRVYGKCTGIDHYFEISSMQIDGIETPVLILLSRYLTYYSVSDISSVHCTYGEESFDMNISVQASISEATGVVTLNGRNANIMTSNGRRSYAACLYESMVCVDIGGIELDANPELNSIMNVTFVTTDYQTISIDFVERDSDSYYVFMNGEYTNFYVFSRELFHDGGTDTFAYGIWPAYELCETAIDNQLNGIYDIPEEE